MFVVESNEESVLLRLSSVSFVRYTCSLINQYSKTFSFFNLLNMLIFAQKSLIIFFVGQKSTIWF